MVGPRRSHRKGRGRGALKPSEPTNPHLCRYCGDLFDRISYIPYPDRIQLADRSIAKFSGEKTKALESFCHWPDFKAFRKSASNGCRLCWKLLFEMPCQERRFLEANPAETRNGAGTIELKHARFETESFELFLSHLISDPLCMKIEEEPDLRCMGSKWTSTTLRLYRSDPQRICNITLAKLRAGHSSMYDVAGSWISKCIANHSDCAK